MATSRLFNMARKNDINTVVIRFSQERFVYAHDIYTLCAEREWIESSILNAWVMYLAQSTPARVAIAVTDAFKYVFNCLYPESGGARTAANDDDFLPEADDQPIH